MWGGYFKREIAKKEITAIATIEKKKVVVMSLDKVHEALGHPGGED